MSVYQKRCEELGLKHFKDSKTFLKYSDDMINIHKNIEEYNPGKIQKAR